MRDIYLNPTDRAARRRISTSSIDGFVATQAASRSTSRRTSPTTPAARCSSRSMPPMRCSACGCSTPAIDWTYRGDGALELYIRAACVRGRLVRRADRHLDRRQMAADRPLEGGGDPDLELALFPLLGRQDHDAHLAGRWPFTGTPDLQRLSAAARRQDRPQRRDQLPLRCRSAPI